MLMILMRGQCAMCGKLTPPVPATNKHDMTAAVKLGNMLRHYGWFADIYRHWNGNFGELKNKFRCPICERIRKQLVEQGKVEVHTRVTEFAGNAAGLKGVQ